MKKKFVCSVLTCFVLGLALAGCGKKPDGQAVDNFQEEQLPDGGNATDGSTGNVAEGADGAQGEEQEENSFKDANEDVEPLPEILNGEWSDLKVQIYDMVFDNKWCMTEEDVRRIVGGSAYNVQLIEETDDEGFTRFILAFPSELPIAYISKHTISIDTTGTFKTDNAIIEYGLLKEGDSYYLVQHADAGIVPSQWRLVGKKYESCTVDFEKLKTKEEVLAYLAECDVIEVEPWETPYYGQNKIYPDSTGAEYADVSHFYLGEKADFTNQDEIKICRVSTISENSQEVKGIEDSYQNKSYSGIHLNLVDTLTIVLNEDDTVDYMFHKLTRIPVFGPRVK